LSSAVSQAAGSGGALVESAFERIDGAFAAEEHPMIVNAAGDEFGVVLGGWCELAEGGFEEGEEVGRLFVREEEGF